MKRNVLRALKAQKTKLLNKKVETVEQFEEVQDKLNEVELKIKELASEQKDH